MEGDNAQYWEALKRMFERKSDLHFSNSDFVNRINIFRAILEKTNSDTVICCHSLDTVLFNNDLFIDSLKKFMSNGKKLTIILDNLNFSEEIKKINKEYSQNLKIFKSNKKLLFDIKKIYNSAFEHDTIMVSGASCIKQVIDKETQVLTAIVCLSDLEESEKINDILKNNIEDLEEIDINGKFILPTVEDVMHKFRGVDLEDYVLRDIVEFSQGKK